MSFLKYYFTNSWKINILLLFAFSLGVVFKEPLWLYIVSGIFLIVIFGLFYTYQKRK